MLSISNSIQVMTKDMYGNQSCELLHVKYSVPDFYLISSILTVLVFLWIAIFMDFHSFIHSFIHKM